MIKRPLFIAFLLVCIAVNAVSALDFDISPNDDGSVDVYLGLEWAYNDLFFSGVAAEYLNGSDRQALETGYVATFDRTISVQGDLIGVSVDEGGITMTTALNIKWDRMSIREIGYLDQDTTRFFILNDRILNLLLPRIRFEGRGVLSPFVVRVGGEYSPWLFVAIDQELTISPGLDATNFHSEQSAFHAYSVNGSFRWNNPILSPEVRFEYDDLRISYGILTAGGEATINNRIEVFEFGVSVVFGFIDVNGLHPTVGFGNERVAMFDLSSESSEPITNNRLRYSIGLEY